jgi:hypothetical protein
LLNLCFMFLVWVFETHTRTGWIDGVSGRNELVSWLIPRVYAYAALEVGIGGVASFL